MQISSWNQKFDPNSSLIDILFFASITKAKSHI